MTEIDPGAPDHRRGGAPPLAPGPVPAGYVPAHWLSGDVAATAHQALPTAGHPVRPDPMTVPGGAAPGGAAPDAGESKPFLDTPGVPPLDRRSAWRWLMYAAIGFVVGQVAAALFGVAAGGLAGKTAAQMKLITSADVPPEWYVVSTLLGIWIGFVGGPWVASRAAGTGRFLADLGVRFRAIDAVGIFIGIGGQIVIAVMYAPFQHDIHNFNAPAQKLTGSSHGGGFIVIAIVTVLVVPVIEEIFFRGLLFKALVRLFTPLHAAPGAARAGGVVLAVVADGLLFGLAHGEWVQLAGLATFGMVLAAVSYRTGRLGMNMVSHASFNLVAVIAIVSQRGGVIH